MQLIICLSAFALSFIRVMKREKLYKDYCSLLVQNERWSYINKSLHIILTAQRQFLPSLSNILSLYLDHNFVYIKSTHIAGDFPGITKSFFPNDLFNIKIRLASNHWFQEGTGGKIQLVNYMSFTNYIKPLLIKFSHQTNVVYAIIL